MRDRGRPFALLFPAKFLLLSRLTGVHGVAARFPFRAQAAHRFAQTGGKGRNGFQALRRALRQAAVAFPPYFREQ
jgi:hypothetical protein